MEGNIGNGNQEGSASRANLPPGVPEPRFTKSPSKEKKTVAEQEPERLRQMKLLMPTLVKNIPPEFLVLYKVRDIEDLVAPSVRPESLAFEKDNFLPEMPPRRKVVVENENKKKKKEEEIKKKDKEYEVGG